MILNAGIKKIIYLEGYPDELAKSLAKEARLEIIQWNFEGVNL
jgi:dCMP deaminase